MASTPIDLESLRVTKLERAFYTRDARVVARAMLGTYLVHAPRGSEARAVRVVETEAYCGPKDLACHARAGLTKRTRTLLGEPARAYVFLIYGMYECLNIVAEPAGIPGCVLVRALQPVAGIEIMRQRRPATRRCEDLASGPGKLTLALGITRAHNGADLTRGSLVVREPAVPRPFEIAVTPRIGITQCADLPLRFVLTPARG